MKIKKLIKELSKYDENLVVILASDAEGNNYSPLEDIYYSEEQLENGKIEKSITLYPI